MSEKDVVTMVDRLRSVLLINKGGYVTPLHATFREFLLDSERCVDPLYHVDAAKGHACLASECLVAFSLKSVTECLVCPPDSILRYYVNYATIYWGEHLERAEFNSKLDDCLRAFVQGDAIPACTRAKAEFTSVGLGGQLYTSDGAACTVSIAQFLKVRNESLYALALSYPGYANAHCLPGF